MEFDKPTIARFYSVPQNNLFKSNRSLLAPYPGQPNYGEIAFAGIKLDDISWFNLHPPSNLNLIFGTKNVFDSIQNGILAKKTNLMVGNALFTKMLGTSYNHNIQLPKGKGIFC